MTGTLSWARSQRVNGRRSGPPPHNGTVADVFLEAGRAGRKACERGLEGIAG